MFIKLIQLMFISAIFLAIVIEAIKINLNRGFGLKDKIPKYVYSILNFIGSFASSLICYKVFCILQKESLKLQFFLYVFLVLGSWALSTVCGATIIKGIVRLFEKLFDKGIVKPTNGGK